MAHAGDAALRAAFPDVARVFLYREPVEVLVSQMRQRGAQTMAINPSSVAYGIEDGLLMGPEDIAPGLSRERVIQFTTLLPQSIRRC